MLYFFSSVYFWLLCQKIRCQQVYGLLTGSSLWFHWSTSCLCWHHAVLWPLCNTIWNLGGDIFSSSLIAQDYFSYLAFFCVSHELKIVFLLLFSVSVKNYVVLLMGTAWNQLLVDGCFILIIPWAWESFPSSSAFFSFFLQCLKVFIIYLCLFLFHLFNRWAWLFLPVIIELSGVAKLLIWDL